MMTPENGSMESNEKKSAEFSVIAQQLQQPILQHNQQQDQNQQQIQTSNDDKMTFETKTDPDQVSQNKEDEVNGLKQSGQPDPVHVNDLDSRVTKGQGQPTPDSTISPKCTEDHRLLRKTRKRTNAESGTTCCPVCSVTLRHGEVSSHLSLEVDRLNKITRGRKSLCKDSGHRKKTSCAINNACADAREPSEVQPDNRYETYLRVKAARMARLSASGRNKAKKKKPNETTCPVCNAVISGTSEELNEHVENCLTAKAMEDEDVDIEGDGGYEEYTWAGQTRIRATTMLQGGSLAGVGMKASCKVEDEDEDMDLNVDEDDEQHFGQTQYSEADIIPCVSEEPEENKERRALRRAFLTAKGEKVPHHSKQLPGDRRRWEGSGGASASSSSTQPSSSCQVPPPTTTDDSSDSEEDENAETEEQYRKRTEEIISALKSKIKDQEEQLSKTDHPKCLICQESYHKPLVSVHCWHVHCEECWLRSLGAKKLCPQCNTITSASDLRRIFL